MTAQFNIREADPAAVARVAASMGLPRFAAATLVARGIDTPEAAQAFLSPSLERDWLNPYDIPGLSDVADLLEEALFKRLHVVVYGDFDLDGISATTVLTRGLRALGGRATPFIPRRFEEGYGITPAAYERLKTLKPDVVVTVDCGIACRDEVAALVADGIKVAVTDHHEASDLVPVGVPVADPKTVDDCESAILAGVGVALKLVQMLGGRRGYPHLWRSYTDFAALGTVADLMPMRGENRALVADGLERMNSNPRPCIAALAAASGVAGSPLTATNLSFSLIPRLNAAGRMGDADLALDLLMSDNFGDACLLAEKLEQVNTQRRSIEADLSRIASEQAKETYKGQRALVVAGEGWHEGVKGIVASRLVNAYGVPAMLFTIDGDEARGSGRSIGSVNLFAAVESLSPLLTRFGGHEAAVGVTLPAENLPVFAQALADYMEGLPEEDFEPMIEVDAEVHLSEFNLDSVAALDLLAPFGQENPVPVYLARNVMLANARAVGADKNHFSCMLTDGCNSVAGIMFNCGSIDVLMETDSVVDAAFNVQIDEWRGRRSVKAMLQTVEPARRCAGLEACLDPQMRSHIEDLYERNNQEVPAGAAPVGGTAAAGIEEDERAELRRRRSLWEQRAKEDPEGLEPAIVSAIIGSGTLHESQRRILDELQKGRSTLAVMATGRGKSLTFQVHAALLALRNRQVSVLVYPLRALIADQAFHLTSTLERFGVVSAVLTGASTPEERRQVWKGLEDGSVDIVLTTPEFLLFHEDEFAAVHRIGFVVVDEAHHIGQAKAGQRMAYRQLGQAVSKLGAPTVLAVTATAPEEVAADIAETLPLQGQIIDDTGRENLRLDDRRNIKNRDDYLAHLIADGGKTVIYVNSREQTVALARSLRRRVPQLAPLIGFYNAGLSRHERRMVEELFRTGNLNVLVATSAFGEGIDIPDIRHVVLYHMPFSEVEFNQMSGRAGRDGRPATVHLLYGRRDVTVNERILEDMTPDHDVMARIYRRMRDMQRRCPGDFFDLVDADLAAEASDPRCRVSPDSVECGIAVFRELGLIETRAVGPCCGGRCMVRVVEDAGKVELTDSVRYREGLDERSVFDDFREWALRCDADGLIVRVSHPITPNGRRF